MWNEWFLLMRRISRPKWHGTVKMTLFMDIRRKKFQYAGFIMKLHDSVKRWWYQQGSAWEERQGFVLLIRPKTKVNSECYIKLLDGNLLPDCCTLYPDNDFIFQQDEAPSHTSRITQEHLDANTPKFNGKDDWPPQSPDLNPMDYHVWDSLSEKAYKGRSTKFTERELKQKIQQCWERIPEGEIRKATASWKKRVRAVCQENGGPIDHLFKWLLLKMTRDIVYFGECFTFCHKSKGLLARSMKFYRLTQIIWTLPSGKFVCCIQCFINP